MKEETEALQNLMQALNDCVEMYSLATDKIEHIKEFIMPIKSILAQINATEHDASSLLVAVELAERFQCQLHASVA